MRFRISVEQRDIKTISMTLTTSPAKALKASAARAWQIDGEGMVTEGNILQRLDCLARRRFADQAASTKLSMGSPG